MWIIMRKTYSGPLGVFFRGQKCDLPESTIKQLRKSYYKETCAPWDEGKDVKAIEQAQLVSEAKDAQTRAKLLADKADEAIQKADSLIAGVSAKQSEIGKTEQAAKTAIARADKAAEHADKQPSVKSLAKATELIAIAHQLDSDSERKELESQKANAELTAAIAESGLKQLEAKDAKRKAKELAEQAGIKIDEPVDEPVDGQVDGAVAEGQAVPA